MPAALFPGLGSVASFSTQVSSTSRKVGAGLAQGVFPPLGFHKTDGFRLAHVPPLVLFPGGGKAGRELQLDQLSTDDGIYIHGRKINCAPTFDKPCAVKFDETTAAPCVAITAGAGEKTGEWSSRKSLMNCLCREPTQNLEFMNAWDLYAAASDLLSNDPVKHRRRTRLKAVRIGVDGGRSGQSARPIVETLPQIG